MSLRGKKLGMLLSASPERPGFQHGLGLAEAALAAGLEVYLYCIDEAVRGINEPRLQLLVERGLKLYGCAFAARSRRLPMNEKINWAGLALLSDLMAAADRMVSFN
jgi:predicted peroxiredoxin